MARDAEQLEQLTAYLDGELTPAERGQVERLLAEDPGAQALLDELRETSRLVSALPREPAPEGLADAVVHRMERRDLLGESPPLRPTNSPVVSWTRRIAIAASIALVGTAVWIAWPHFPELMTAEKQPIRLAQADRAQETLTPPRFLEQGGGSKIGKTKSLRPSARRTIGEALVEDTVRGKAPLALGGYVGGGADKDDADKEAEDEAVPAFARRFAAKLKSRDAEQPSALASTAPESARSVIVETDAATIARLADLVKRNMARHAVRMLQAEAQERVAARDEAYFTIRSVASSSPASYSTGVGLRADLPGDEVHIIMRVPRSVAGQVLTDMYRISGESDAAAGWTRVGRPFVPARAAGDASNRTEEKDLPTGADEDVAKESPPTLDRLEKKRTVSPAKQDAAESKDEGLFDAEPSPAQKRDLGRLDSVGAASQPAAPPDEPLVTLTIRLRTKPAISPPSTTQASTQPAGQPTPQATPRSTTQEAHGG